MVLQSVLVVIRLYWIVVGVSSVRLMVTVLSSSEVLRAGNIIGLLGIGGVNLTVSTLSARVTAGELLARDFQSREVWAELGLLGLWV